LKGKPKYSEKTCPGASLFTTNSTRSDLGSNLGRRGRKPGTTRVRPHSMLNISKQKQKKKQTPWSESASELYRPSDRLLSAKWLPTLANRGCQVVSVTDPYGRILGFLDRSRNFSIK
jgi:hypothetical protein